MHVLLLLLLLSMSPVASAQETSDAPDDAERTDVVESLNQAENEMSRFLENDLDEPGATYPHLSGDIIFRLGFNGEYEVEGEREETIDEFLDMIASPTLHINQRLRLDSEIRLETTSLPTDNRRFEDEGLFVRQLFLEYDVTDALMVRAGKITPTFALASLVTPGPFGNNYSKEIELIERLGLETLYTIDGGSAGRHTFTASTFFDDTTFLSESLGSNRGRTSLDDGGASNTESFESFTLTFGGQDIEALPGFRYQVGYIHEAAGRGDAGDENGFMLGGTWTTDLGEDTTFMAIAEFAPLWNFEGSDDDIIYTSGGVVLNSGPWSAVLSGTHRRRDFAQGGIQNDYTVQTSVEYYFENGFSIAIAHEFLQSEGFDVGRVGVRINYIFEF